MTVEDIKERFSMREILDRCNIQIERGGFCKCVFHKGDNEPSMKIYDKSYYCFGCQETGDVITFVQKYNGLSFKDACEWISGEELSDRTRRQIAVAKIKRKSTDKDRQELKEDMKSVTLEMADYWQRYKEARPVNEMEPFSDEYADNYNKWQLLCYKQDCIDKQLGAL